jgi:hypothetical protein
MSDDESPIVSSEIVDRPDSEEPEDMWDFLVDLCQNDDDLEALIQMRAEAEGWA